MAKILLQIRDVLADSWRKSPSNIKFLLRTYILFILYFFVLRIIFLAVQHKNVAGTDFSEILSGFVLGWRFDTTISLYILLLPILIAWFLHFSRIKCKYIQKSAQLYLSLIMFFVNLGCVADIPYYDYFHSRLTVAAFSWLDNIPMLIELFLQHEALYPFLFLFLLSNFVLLFLINKLTKIWLKEQFEESDRKTNIWFYFKSFAMFVLFGIVVFAGIRGRISRMPISWATAYYSANQTLNQLALNPMFTFGKSYLDNQDYDVYNVSFMDESDALENIKNYIYNPADTFNNNPVARKVEFDSPSQKYNVVIILMESMSECYMGRSGNYRPSLTPFLDSLITKSIYFSNFYSAGIHTHNGMWSTFTSLPSLPFDKVSTHDMNNMQEFAGITQTLKHNGYNTVFACAQDAQFDNINALMKNCGVDKIISETDFGIDDIVGLWGAPDHKLFDKVLNEMDNLSLSGKPFAFSLLTVSNHGPYRIPEPLPEGLNLTREDIKLRVVEYSDWSLKYFFEKAEKTKWFDNTIFVLLPDHGAALDGEYDISLCYHKSPLIFYAPKILKTPAENDKLAMQIDVFPTLMDILKINYVNNTFGIDLISNSRQFAFFCEDKKIGILNDEFLYIERSNDVPGSLYRYRQKDLSDYSAAYPELVDSMKRYFKTFFQTTNYMIKNSKAGYIGK